jgi:hypothetical protein
VTAALHLHSLELSLSISLILTLHQFSFLLPLPHISLPSVMSDLPRLKWTDTYHTVRPLNGLSLVSLLTALCTDEPHHHPMCPSSSSPMCISCRPPVIDGIGAEFVSSALNAGIPFTPDFNDPEGREGAGYYHFNIKGNSCTSPCTSSASVALFLLNSITKSS